MPVSVISMQEWEDGNQQRRYPFSDNSPMVADSGFKIPNHFFSDGILHPFDLEGHLYLSAIDHVAGEFVLSDSANNNEKGRAPITADVLTFKDERGRHVGKLVIGRDGTALSSLAGTHNFNPTDTQFAPAAVFAQNQRAVRGIVLPDGTLLTGDVTIVGENGVRITAEPADADGNLGIYVNAVGVATRPPGSRLGDPITSVCISQPGASVLSINRDENVILLGHCLPLRELCGTKDYLARPGGKLPPHADTPHGHDRDEDPCDDPPIDPPPNVCPDPIPYDCDQPIDYCGHVYLVSTSDVLHICNTSIPDLSSQLQGFSNSLVGDTGAGGSCTDEVGRGADLVSRQLPPRAQQGLKIISRV